FLAGFLGFICKSLEPTLAPRNRLLGLCVYFFVLLVFIEFLSFVGAFAFGLVPFRLFAVTTLPLDFIIFLVVFRLLKFQCHLGLQVTNGHHSQTTYGRQSKDLAYPIQVKRQVGLIRWVSLPSATPSART